MEALTVGTEEALAHSLIARSHQIMDTINGHQQHFQEFRTPFGMEGRLDLRRSIDDGSAMTAPRDSRLLYFHRYDVETVDDSINMPGDACNHVPYLFLDVDHLTETGSIRETRASFPDARELDQLINGNGTEPKDVLSLLDSISNAWYYQQSRDFVPARIVDAISTSFDGLIEQGSLSSRRSSGQKVFNETAYLGILSTKINGSLQHIDPVVLRWPEAQFVLHTNGRAQHIVLELDREGNLDNYEEIADWRERKAAVPGAIVHRNDQGEIMVVSIIGDGEKELAEAERTAGFRDLKPSFLYAIQDAMAEFELRALRV